MITDDAQPSDPDALIEWFKEVIRSSQRAIERLDGRRGDASDYGCVEEDAELSELEGRTPEKKGFTRERALREMREKRLLTNDLVELACGATSQPAFRVNGRIYVPLKRREYVVLRILAEHRQAGGDYLSAKEIADLILAEALRKYDKDEAKALDEGFWENADEQDVYKAMSSLREKLRIKGVPDELLERGVRGVGYRLSTPAQNITFSDCDKEWIDDSQAPTL